MSKGIQVWKVEHLRDLYKKGPTDIDVDIDIDLSRTFDISRTIDIDNFDFSGATSAVSSSVVERPGFASVFFSASASGPGSSSISVSASASVSNSGESAATLSFDVTPSPFDGEPIDVDFTPIAFPVDGYGAGAGRPGPRLAREYGRRRQCRRLRAGLVRAAQTSSLPDQQPGRNEICYKTLEISILELLRRRRACLCE
ncbi:MAG: hypothetical protein AAGC56_09770 [Pseudomonadota bacterium]